MGAEAGAASTADGGAADGGRAGDGEGAAGAGAGEAAAGATGRAGAGAGAGGGLRMMWLGGEIAAGGSSSSSGSGCSRRFSAASRITVALCMMCGSGSNGSEGGRGGGAGKTDGGRLAGEGVPRCAGALSSICGCGAFCHFVGPPPSDCACLGSPMKYCLVPSRTLVNTSILRTFAASSATYNNTN